MHLRKHRNFVLIWNTTQVVLIFLMRLQILDRLLSLQNLCSRRCSRLRQAALNQNLSRNQTQRVRGRRSQSGGPDSGDNAKKKPTVKPPKVRSSAAGFSFLRRLPLMLLAPVVTCLTQLGTAAEVMFGKAIDNIVLIPFHCS